MHWNRRDWLVVALLTLLAAALRLYQLGAVPPGFQFDEAYNAVDAQQVLQGNYPLFLPANGGREVLYTYWQAAVGALLGVNVYSLRLASALMGILAVPIAYALLRGMVQKDSRKIALFTALTLALSLWHIHFSHYAIRVITMPVLLSGVFGFFWMGGHNRRWKRILAYSLSGLLTGLTVWTHPAGRFLPFAFILYTIWLLTRTPRRQRWRLEGPLTGLLLTGLVAFLTFLPLGFEFYRHPEFFFGHASEVSVFAERVSGESPLAMLGANILHVAGMFAFKGDLDWTHNLAGRPIFDPLMAVPFFLGLALWALILIGRKKDRPPSDVDALALLALWAGVMLIPTLFTEAAPNYSRALPTLPALFTASGLGFTWLWGFRRPVEWLGRLAVIAILVVGAVFTVRDYYITFANSPEIYYVYDAHKIEGLERLAELTSENTVYLSRLWGEKHATVNFLRHQVGVKSFDSADLTPLPPPGQGAVYAFPPEQLAQAEAMAGQWSSAEVEILHDKYGEMMLVLVRISPETAARWPDAMQPQKQREARFVDAPTLLGMQPSPQEDAVVLFWRAEYPMLRDLTTFIHLLDREGRRVGQADKAPGNGSYRTPVWTPGERVVNRYHLKITEPCIADEDLRVVVGWYDLAADGRRMPRADGAGDTALAGVMRLPPRSFSAGQVHPDILLDPQPTAKTALYGASVQSEDLQPGSPLTVDLYWQAGAAGPPESTPVSVTLANDQGVSDLWLGSISADARPAQGEILCTRQRLHLPTDLAPGNYRLDVRVHKQIIELTDLTVGESRRRYDVPPLAESVQATFADQIALLGLLTEPTPDSDSPLRVTLVWQALRRPEGNFKVFVHLVDDQGRIVAQSDAAPAAGYNATAWLPGEVIVDEHALVANETGPLPPGRYKLYAGLYDANGGGARLAVVNNDGAGITDGRVLLMTLDLPIVAAPE